MKTKLVTIVGTRPEIIRLSSIIKKFDYYFDHTLIHTGQNYDYELNEIFFKDLGLREPDYSLKTKSNSTIQTIANIISKVDRLISKIKPDVGFYLGDTNSCLSSIVLKKRKIPVFHYEAGNRCFDKNVPEELNRILVDNIADINLTYSKIAREYLIRENFPQDRIVNIGSPMFEVIKEQKRNIQSNKILNKLKLKKNEFFLISTHREENVENSKKFKTIVELILYLKKKYKKKIVISCHPRINKKINKQNKLLDKNIIIAKPFSYSEYMKLQTNALLTISDSGTITEESSILNFKAINLRNNHERPEGMEEASVILSSLVLKNVINAVEIMVKNNFKNHIPTDYFKDNISDKVIKIIISYIEYVKRYVWLNEK